MTNGGEIGNKKTTDWDERGIPADSRDALDFVLQRKRRAEGPYVNRRYCGHVDVCRHQRHVAT